jgi:hypothetical protein
MLNISNKESYQIINTRAKTGSLHNSNCDRGKG